MALGPRKPLLPMAGFGDAALDGCLIVTGFVVLLFWLRHEAQTLAFPFPLDYGEGPLLDQAARLVAGKSLYPPPGVDYPFVVTNYPPIFPILLSVIGRFYPVTLPLARFVVLVASSTCVILVGAIAHARTRDWRSAVAAPTLFVASPYFFGWSVFARNDFVALALGLGAILLALRKPESYGALAGCAMLASLAVFTRQSHLLAAPCAIAAGAFVWQPKRAVFFLTFFCGLVVGAYLAMQNETHQAFFFHVVVANANHWSASQLARVAGSFVGPGGPAFILAAVVMWRAPRRDAPKTTLVVFALGAIASAATAGKIGASLNYLLEAVAGVSILASNAAARAWSARPVVRRLILAGVTAEGAVLATQSSIDAGAFERRIRERSEYAELARVVARENAPILADECMGLLPLMGRPVLVQPFEFTQLALQGLWDERRVVADIRAGRFGLVLIRDDPAAAAQRWTPAMFDAIRRRYILRGHLADTAVFQPDAHSP